VIIDIDVLRHNIATMSRIHPGAQLRPHMKATKCTSLAKLQVESGHLSFTCATPREMIGMAQAGLGADLLLANETLDATRLSAMAKLQDSSMITVAIDSEATLDAAAKAGIHNVLIDVNVGLPRCGVLPNLAGALADDARKRGLNVRGVMGYEGHLMMVSDKNDRLAKVAESMLLLQHAAKDVGGEIISAGGTGTYDLHENTGVTEIQAGSYSLMDTQYSQLNLPFGQAVWVVGTVISSGSSWSVADVGLKSLGMDHGDPSIENQSVWFCSDEHITFATSTGDSPKVGSRIRVTPAHIDPTLAMHDIAWIVRGDEVIDQWAIDLRGW
jgi:D-serine deaminase-like pyridoxal phosphate-dependent protein